MRSIHAALAANILYSGAAYAAAACDAIIVHGLRNIEVSSTKVEALSMKYQQNCGKDFAATSDETLANAEVQVFGYGGGSGGFSRKQREERLKQWCDTNQAAASSVGSTSTNSHTFYQGAVTAWDSCNRLYSQSMIINPIISPDARNVSIGIVYTGPSPSGVKLYGVQADGFTCSTTTPDTGLNVTFPVSVKTENIQVRCTRSPTKTVVKDGTSYEVAARGVIDVQTASDPFQLFFAEEVNPELSVKEASAIKSSMTKMDLPVGTIISSALPPAQFLSPGNPQYDPFRWVEANGGNLPPGSKYEQITGAKVAPNLGAYQGSTSILDVISKTLVPAATNISTLQTPKGNNGEWTWYASLGDIAGQRVNNDFEQDSDNFRVTIEPSGSLFAAGRTLNWKQTGWANWHNGSANVLGISTIRNPFHYYIKVN